MPLLIVIQAIASKLTPRSLICFPNNREQRKRQKCYQAMKTGKQIVSLGVCSPHPDGNHNTLPPKWLWMCLLTALTNAHRLTEQSPQIHRTQDAFQIFPRKDLRWSTQESSPHDSKFFSNTIIVVFSCYQIQGGFYVVIFFLIFLTFVFALSSHHPHELAFQLTNEKKPTRKHKDILHRRAVSPCFLVRFSFHFNHLIDSQKVFSNHSCDWILFENFSRAIKMMSKLNVN